MQFIPASAVVLSHRPNVSLSHRPTCIPRSFRYQACLDSPDCLAVLSSHLSPPLLPLSRPSRLSRCLTVSPVSLEEPTSEIAAALQNSQDNALRLSEVNQKFMAEQMQLDRETTKGAMKETHSGTLQALMSLSDAIKLLKG